MGIIRKSKSVDTQEEPKITTMNSKIKSKCHKQAEKWSKYLKAKNY